VLYETLGPFKPISPKNYGLFLTVRNAKRHAIQILNMLLPKMYEILPEAAESKLFAP
jgi:hypothetical protein